MNTRKVRKILTPAITSVLVVTMTAGLAFGMSGGRALAETYVDSDTPVCDHAGNSGDWVEINEDMIAENNIGDEDAGEYAIEIGEGKKYFLGGDVTVDILVSSSATLCLNGHTLTGSGAETGRATYGDESFYRNNSVINVQGEDTVLGLTDCNENYSGVVKGYECNYGLLCVNGGRINMYGGTVTGNGSAQGASGIVAGGAYVANGGYLNMLGGEISGNTAYTGGVLVYGTSSSNQSRFAMTSSLPVVSGNTGVHGGGVQVNGQGAKFTINNGKLTGNKATLGGGVYVWRSNNAFVMHGGEVSDNSADEGGAIYINSDVKSGGSYAYDSVSGGVITGNTAVNGGAVYVGEGELYFKCTGSNGIEDNKADECGGGVYVSEKGEFSFVSGEVSGNKAEYGGGVYYEGDATLTGDVHGNTATSSGGGVYASGDLSLSGDVYGNTAKEYGGGVYLAKGADLTIESGHSVYENKAEVSGGGIYTESGRITVADSSSVSVNEAGSDGGGIYLGGGRVTLSGSGCSVCSNTALGCGGGIYSESGTVTISGYGASVSENEASGCGGGIYMEGGSLALTGENSSVSYNTAACSGGGVFIESGTAEMTGENSSVSGNAAGGNGGGVYMHHGEFLMSAGEISGNEAKGTAVVDEEGDTGLGGGLYLNDGAFTMTGGNIFGNTAVKAGGAYMFDGTLYMEGSVVIAENKVTNSAGEDINLYLHGNDDTVTLTGALTEGSLVYIACDYDPEDDGHAIIEWDEEEYAEDLLEHIVSENNYVMYKNVAEGRLEIFHVAVILVDMYYGDDPVISVRDTRGDEFGVISEWTAVYYIQNGIGNYEVVEDIKSADVGTYFITVHVEASSEYSAFDSGMSSFEIKQKNISDAVIEFDGSLTYGYVTQTQKIKSVTVDGLDVTYNIVNNSDKATDAKDYTLYIEGTGNFTGTAYANFTVEPFILTSNNVKRLDQYKHEYDGLYHTLAAEDMLVTFVYTDADGKEQTYTLVLGDDYTFSATGGSDVGRYEWDVVGIWNFTGTVAGDTVIESKSIADAQVTVIGAYTYNGMQQTPELNIVLEGFSSDDITYTLTMTDGDGVSAGTHIFRIVGKGNFTGTVSGLSFTIAKADITDAEIDGSETSVTYTGGAHTYDIFAVYVEGIEGALVNGTDFEVKTDITTYVDAGEYKITIEGINNFTGSQTVTFIVAPADLADAEVTFAENLTYNGTTQTAVIKSVSIGELELTEGTDYTVTGDFEKTDAGEYEFTITAAEDNGNFTGYAVLTFVISPFDISGAVIGEEGETTHVYDGTDHGHKITSVTVTMNGKEVELDESDYSVYSETDDFINAGTYVVTVTGKGNFQGTVTETFYITEASVSEASIEIGTMTYDGTEQEVTISSVTVTVGDVIVDVDDYYVVYGCGTDAGTYTAYLYGQGNFKDFVAFEFTIDKFDLSLAEITVETDSTFVYNENEHSYEITGVYIEAIEMHLSEDTDYTMDRDGDFTSAGEHSFTITAVTDGNYKGSATVYFYISPASIEEGLEVLLGDALVYNGEEQSVNIASVTLEGFTKALTEGTDYEVINGTASDAGTHTYSISGKGNFEGSVYLQFTVERFDLSAAEMTVNGGNEQTFTYTGSAQTFVITTLTALGVTGELKEGTDYAIVSGTDTKTDAGNYKVTITGNGNFTGTYEIDFVIDPASIVGANVTSETYTYNGITRSVNETVTLTGFGTLTRNKDYTLSGVTSTADAGYHEYFVNGCGNFTGTVECVFTIYARSIDDAIIETSERLVYNGQPQSPEIVVTEVGLTLEYGVDYVLSGLYEETDAGMYIFTIEGIGNFTGSKSISYTIYGADISDIEYELGVTTFVYDGTAHTVTISSVTLKGFGPLTEGTDYEIADASATKAGTYEAVISGIGNFAGTVTVTYTIEAFDISTAVVIVNGGVVTEFTYDGTEQVLTISSVTVEGVTGTLKRGTDYVVTGDTDRGTDADEYFLIMEGRGNFTGTASVRAFVVGRRDINGANIVSGDELKKVYSGEAQDYAIDYVHISDGEMDVYLEYGADYEIETHADSFMNVDVYTITIIGINNFTGSHEVEFEIVAAELGDVIFEYEPLIYTGREQAVNILCVVAEGFSESLDFGTDYEIGEGSTLSGTDAGTYFVTLTGVGNFTGTAEVSFRIDPASIEKGLDVTLGETLIYNGNTQRADIASVTLDGFDSPLAEGADYEIAEGTDLGTDAGDYTVVLVGVGNFEGTFSVAFVIERRDIADADVVSESAVYDGTTQSASPAVKIEGIGALTYGDDYTLYGDFSAADADTYTYFIVGANNFKGSIECEFTISPLDIGSGSVEITGTHVYDGTEQSPEFTVTGTGFTLTLGTDYELTGNYTGINAGVYDFSVTGKGNFTGEIEASFTITPADIEGGKVVLSWNTVTYDGKEHSPEVTNVTLEGFDGALEEDIDYSVSGTLKATDAGTYTVTVEGTGNFTGTIEATFTITSASIESDLDVTLSAETLVYSGAEQTVSVSSVTLKGFDGVLVEDRDYFVSGTLEATDAGTYYITITGDGNFEGTFEVSYTIESFSLSGAVVTVNGGEELSFTYDGIEQVYEITSVAVAGISGVLIPGTDYYVTGITRAKDAGSYTVVIVGEGNFTGSYTTGFEILPANVKDAEIKSGSYEYTGKLQGVNPTVTMEKIGTLNLYTDYVLSGEPYATEAGTYTYFVMGLGNFTGMVECTFTIEALDIGEATLNFTETYTYDGTAQKPDFNVTVNGLSVTYEWAEGDADFTATDTGTYKLEIYGTGNFTGTLKFDFVILQRDISGATVVSDDGQHDKVYNGEEHGYDIEDVHFDDGIMNVYLVHGIDYEIEFHSESFINAGTYTITIYGINNFIGSHTVEFEIKRAALTGATLVYDSLTYNGGYQDVNILYVSVDGISDNLLRGTDFVVIEEKSILSAMNADTYTITISGYGNFEGTVEVYFEILPADIGGAVFEVNKNVVLTYDGTVLIPDISEVTLYDGGTDFGTLIKGTDYIVYVWATDAGTNTGYVVGTGNFTGLKSFTYEIKQRSIENVTVETGEELVKVYNGEDHSYDLDTVHITDHGTATVGAVRTLADTVEYEGYLINGVDYDVEHDKDCVNVGEYTITINGINNFTGSHTVTFVIVAAPLDGVTLNCGEITYSGKEQKANVVSAEMIGIKGSLTLGYDFVIVDESELYATEAGVHYVSIVAGSSGNFDGETLATFTVYPKDIAGAYVGVNGSTSVVYDGTDHVHTITGVSLEGFGSLYLGQDYYVEHDHDKFVDAGTYYVSVFGTGNFTGEIDIEFDVLPADITKAVLSGELSFVYDGKEKTFNPVVTSSVGTLKFGTDYFLEIKEESVKNAGTYSYTITGNGNYEGTIEGTFVIDRLDISGALISTGGTLTYDGTSQSAEIVVVRIGSLDVTYVVKENSGTDVGLHDIVIEGTGNFTGTATGSFYIAPRSLSGADVTATETFTYSGSVQSPVVTEVYLGDIGFTLTDNADFVTVLGSEYSADVGIYSYTIHGIGNFTGDIERMVTINCKDIFGADIVLGESLTYTGYEQFQTVQYVISDGLTVTYKLISGYNAVNAGDYTLVVEGTGNFEGTASVVWTMEKAVPVYSVPASLTGNYGHTLATIVFTDNRWSWVDEHESVGEVGTNYHLAVFTPNDTDNYLTVTVSLEVTVTVGGSQVIAIKITSDPYRTEYTAFESFDRTGMVVTVYFEDGTGEILSDYTVTGGESLRYGTDGIQTITISYMGFTGTVTVSVAKITVTTPVAFEGLVYDGTEQFGINILEEYPFDISEIFVISGTISATNAGDYEVTLTLADTENYSWDVGSVTISWSIGRAEPSVTDVFTEDWVYGEDGTLPTFDTVSDGVVTFMYYRFDEDSEEWEEYGTDMTGAEIGLYAVKIIIAETENCYACESDLYEFYVVAPEEPAEGDGDGEDVGEDVGATSESIGRSGELTTEIIIVLAIIAAAAVVLIIVFGCVTNPKKKP